MVDMLNDFFIFFGEKNKATSISLCAFCKYQNRLLFIVFCVLFFNKNIKF